jgi:RNA polymerase sigma-70 factor (ECF subfamily)
MVIKFYPDLEKEAEDIVQQVFFLVIKYKDKFLNNSEKIVKSLLYTYTNSVCINYIKRMNCKKKSIKMYIEKNESSLEEAELLPKELIKKEYVIKAKNIINNLPYPEKEIILMKYIYEMKNVEIADLLELTETNVGTMLQRSLKKVRQQMEENDFAGIHEF